MKKIVILTASYILNGNGDTLTERFIREAEKKDPGVSIVRFDLRRMKIGYCHGCYACARTGECWQKDDFGQILKEGHEADGILAVSPIYYNMMAAPLITVINRLCSTFAYKDYAIGPRKKVGVFLTCSGSDPEEMKHHVENVVTLPSVHRWIRENRTEVFTHCKDKNTCRQNPSYLKRAENMADWFMSTDHNLLSGI